MQELSSFTRLTQLHIRFSDNQIASSSLQCLSALRRLRALDIDLPGRQDGADWATAPPLSHCTALTRLRWVHVPTQVHTHIWHIQFSHPSWVPRLLSGLSLACAHLPWPCPQLDGLHAVDIVHLESVIPCVHAGTAAVRC